MPSLSLAFPNGFQLEILLEDRRFLGLGEVRHDGRLLRCRTLPWTFYTESDDGFRFEDFEWIGIEAEADGAQTLVFRSAARWLPRLQAADAMGDARVVTRRVAAPVAHFRWTFRPVTETIGETAFSGLALSLAIESPGHPLHWVIEDATWEIDGVATGAELIQQDVSTIDLEQVVRADSAFSTIEKFFTKGWGGAYPMDMLPRAAGSSILDFQVKGDTALCLFAERPGLTRSRIEKFAGEDLIHYTDRPFFALGENVVTPERKLLVHRAPRPFLRHAWRNLWLDCFTEVRRRLHAAHDFQLEKPRPLVWAHLWDKHLKLLGRSWTDALREALPDYRRLGFAEVFTHGVWESAISDPAPPIPGNICAPYDFRFAEAFGGAAKMRELADAARGLDLEIFQWFSFHISKVSAIWREHPDWLMREANGDPWDGNYGDIFSGRIRSEYGRWFQGRVEEVRRDTGIAGIFWDSYQNLGVTCVDWQGPDKTPQAADIWRMQAELQKAGRRQRCEITTVFGVSNVGLFGFEGDSFRRRLWQTTVDNDDVFALLDCAPGFFTDQPIFSAERISPRLYFWMAGHRVVPAMPAMPWDRVLPSAPKLPRLPGGDLAEAYGRVNHLYLAAFPFMERLRLTEGGGHTLWLDAAGQPAVIWAFRDGEAIFAEAPGPVLELEDPRLGGVAIAAGERLPLRAGRVYLLGEAAAGFQPVPDETSRAAAGANDAEAKAGSIRRLLPA